MAEDLGAVLTRVASNGQQLNIQMGSLINKISGLLPFSGSIGTLTATAGTTSTVANASVKANSLVVPVATNATAATLLAGGWYISARTAGVSFALTFTLTAAGSETLVFAILNPS
jgi:hypothetical protein